MTPTDSGLLPLVFSRAGNALTMGIVIVAMLVLTRIRRMAPTGEPERAIVPEPREEGLSAELASELSGEAAESSASRRPWWLIPVGISLAVGVMDGIANIALLTGMRVGELTIMSVLNALYPAGTIVLAAVLLRERIAPVQAVGLVVAITAAALLALA